MELTVTYTPIMAFPFPIQPPPKIILLFLVSQPVTGTSLVDVPNDGIGPNEPVPNLSTIDIVFRMNTSAGPAGPMVEAYAQEKITDKKFRGQPQEDSDWTPWPPQDNTLFQQWGGHIHDIKGTNLPAHLWNPIPVGEKFFTFRQQMRLRWFDPCNVEHLDMVGDFRLARK